MTEKNETMSQAATLENKNSIENKEKTAQLMWTGFILGFFVIQAIIWIIAISITARDASHAVVAGYDEKALKWDDQKALSAASVLMSGFSCVQRCR